MFSWSPRQRVRIEHIDAEAEALINHFGVEAYSEARRREREASSDAIAEDWDRVALMVARKTEGRAQSTPEREPASKVDQIEELMRIVGEPPPRRPKVLTLKRRRRGR